MKRKPIFRIPFHAKCQIEVDKLLNGVVTFTSFNRNRDLVSVFKNILKYVEIKAKVT
jgi:hypothetical protein